MSEGSTITAFTCTYSKQDISVRFTTWFVLNIVNMQETQERQNIFLMAFVLVV